MKTKIFFTCLLALLVYFVYGQSYEPGKLWVSVASDDARAFDISSTKVEEINSVFDNYNVTSYEQIMWFAKTPSLRNIYEIDCECDEIELRNRLISFVPEYFNFIEQVPEPIVFYDPNDHFWQVERFYLWHLTKIQADSAWDLTIGNNQVKIGITDTGYDLEHPDLATQIYPPFDPYSGFHWDPKKLLLGNSFHGTTVASFAAAKTAETGTNPVPNGNLSAIGFNCKMVGTINNLPNAVFLSSELGCDVINASWMVHPPDPHTDSLYRDAVKEILGNGTVIVTAAGNGLCTTIYKDTQGNEHLWGNCDAYPPDFQEFSAPYPFNPKYDSTIIVVTSTDSNDNHILLGDTVLNRTHSHFPEVDVCSPGWYIMGATLTYHVDENGDTVKKQWPYSGGWGGTSFAAPIVSGLCGLIKSINPCLTPGQVEEIIKLTTDPVQDEYPNYVGLIGTGRINAYHAVKYAQENYGYEEYTIMNGQDITWTSDMQAKKISIEWGGKLTIKSTVFMLPGSDIIVYKGGELVIDSGHITTCKGLWNGIQVRGRIDEDQYSFYHQGHLTMKNGAIIENAKCGVQTIALDTGGFDPYSTGGIIQATDASFINCVTGVAFYPYENYLNDKKNIKNNLSYLNHCNFILDSNYNHVFFNPKQFIYLEDVRGISIKGCAFNNQIRSSEYEDVTLIDPDKMMGINSLNTAFIVDDYCLNPVYPCDTTVPCIFKNLNYGIHALNTHSEKYPVVKRSHFEYNRSGIYTGAINNAEIYLNQFIVKAPFDDDSYGSESILSGIYFDHSSDYRIEENLFASNYINQFSMGISVGMVINSSGPYANEVYKNDFNRLKYGVIAMNINKRDTVGLCMKCNTFDSCAYDISVVADVATRGWGIAEYQGSSEDTTTAPAGNVFTSYFSAHTYDLFNDQSVDPFTYFHHDESQSLAINVEPDFYTESVSLSNTGHRYDSNLSCPSRMGGGGNPSIERIAMNDGENQVTSIASSLELFTDGGNTPYLTMVVTAATPPEAVDLTNQLLGESPYLSDTVMKSAIEKEDVLTNAMIRDVLVVNPQSAKSDEIMQMLDERMDPMPQYMKNQIAQGKFTTGDKENLEARRNFYLSEQARAFHNLNRIYQSDSTVSFRLDSLTILFDDLPSLENQYRKAFIQAENGDTILAISTIGSVPSAFSLTEEQLNNHQKYEDLLDIIIDMSNPSSSVMTLDSAQIAGLLDIYDDYSLPGIYARNMLITAGYLTYKEPFLFPDDQKKLEVKPVSGNIYENSVIIKVFPNPAAYYSIIEFDVSEKVGINATDGLVSIIVRDVRGITQKTLSSTNNKDQLVLDVRSFKPGLYFIELLLEGKRMNTTKVIVER